MSDRAHQGFSTRAIRAASKTPAVNQRPTTVQSYKTATSSSSDAEELADVVSDGRSGYSYSRLSNPTSRALGDAFAEISGAEAGTTLASGMGAVHAALGANLSAGDRVVGPLAAYGSSRKLLSAIFRRYGVRVARVNRTDTATGDRAIAEAPTKVVYAETIANPTTAVTDHATVARIAHEHGATYIVDNTFATPYV